MIVRSEGNQLFFDSQEIREWACGRSDNPAHYHKIRCVGSSLKGAHIISADENGTVKVWDPSRPRLEQRTWLGQQGFKDLVAVGVNDGGNRMALAVGLKITVYDVRPNEPAKELECATLPLKSKITFLQFTDDDHVVCHDSEGGRVILERDPAWKVKS